MGTQRTILEPCAPEKTFGSVTHRTDRDSYRAKYTHNGEVITKTFKDGRSAQAWLSAEKALVEADRAGIQRVDSPADRKRQEEAVRQRRTLLCDYVMEEFAPTWLNYSSDGAELTAGSKRKHREYLAHLSHAFFWKYHLAGITTEDINRWLANLDNFGGATPRKKTFHLLEAVYTKAVAEGAVDKSPVTMKAPQSQNPGKLKYHRPQPRNFKPSMPPCPTRHESPYGWGPSLAYESEKWSACTCG